MIKICVIGNSHAACLKKAWDSKGLSDPRWQMDFFASSGESARDTYCDDGVIKPQTKLVKRSWKMTSGGKEQIVVADYDVIILHGLLQAIKKVHQTIQPFLSKGTPYSTAVALETMGNYDPKLGHFRKMLNSFDKPILLASKPNLAVANASSEELPPSECDYLAMVDPIVGTYNRLGVNYIAQPRDTLFGLNNTRSLYNDQGLGLTHDVPKEGYRLAEESTLSHMNETFGLKYLQAYETWLMTNGLLEK